MAKKGAIQDKPEPGLKALALRMYSDGAPWEEISEAVPWRPKTIAEWDSQEGITRGKSRHNDIADAADLKLKHSYDDHERIAVEIGARVLNKHRSFLRAMRQSLVGMLQELDEAGEDDAENAALVQEFYAARAIRDPLGAQRYKAKLEKALELAKLPGRVRTMSTLVGSASTIIDHERKAYRMDKDEGAPNQYENILRTIVEERKRLEKAEQDNPFIEGESHRVD